MLQPYDMEMGAGTFHSATFLRAVGPEPWSAAYVQPSRRPTDGRYGNNPFRLQHYYQFQVCIKPSPDNFQELYLDSLRYLGFDPLTHDIRFVEDNWESPTLGAWGLGWEVWINGMEVSQFTYFQQVGGLDCRPVMGEITYGLERLAMYIQGKESIFDIVWTDGPFGTVTYGDVFHQNEVEQSTYNFEKADTAVLSVEFDACEAACRQLLKDKLVLPAYEQMVKASHAFNLLDARHAVSVTERQRFILRVRTLARGVAEGYRDSREALGFPLLKNADAATSGLMSTKDLLFELCTEELPPRTLPALSKALTEGLAKGHRRRRHCRMARFTASRRRGGLRFGSRNWRNISRTGKWSGADRRSPTPSTRRALRHRRRRLLPKVAASPSANCRSSPRKKARGCNFAAPSAARQPPRCSKIF